MSDLRERLRDLQDHYSTSGQLGERNRLIFAEAADEIARLRAGENNRDELILTLIGERDDLRAQAFKYLQECGKQAVRADAAEAQLANARKALEEIAATKDNGPDWSMAKKCQRIAAAALTSAQGKSE